MVGNKNDCYVNEEVTNMEGIELAKQLKAIYQRTSALEEFGGIDELFKNIGRKFINPSIELNSYLTKEERKQKGEKIMREKIKNEKKKMGCC